MSDKLNVFLTVERDVKKEVFMKRFDTNFTIKAISNDEFYSIREQATYGTTVDETKVGNLLVAAGIVEPKLNDPAVIKHYGAHDAADVVSKALFFGEVQKLQQEIFELSGLDIGEQISQAKN